MKPMNNTVNLICALIFSLFLSTAAYSGTVNDADALRGYNQGKIVFDINLKDKKALSLYLDVIKRTHNDLIKQEINPDIILAFRGLAVTLVQASAESATTDQKQMSDQIEFQIKELQAMGVKMEVCSVATGLFQVSNENIFKDMKIVGNTFISLMGYQHQGYAIIPIM